MRGIYQECHLGCSRVPYSAPASYQPITQPDPAPSLAFVIETARKFLNKQLELAPNLRKVFYQDLVESAYYTSSFTFKTQLKHAHLG